MASQDADMEAEGLLDLPVEVLMLIARCLEPAEWAEGPAQACRLLNQIHLQRMRELPLRPKFEEICLSMCSQDMDGLLEELFRHKSAPGLLRTAADSFVYCFRMAADHASPALGNACTQAFPDRVLLDRQKEKMTVMLAFYSVIPHQDAGAVFVQRLLDLLPGVSEAMLPRTLFCLSSFQLQYGNADELTGAEDHLQTSAYVFPEAPEATGDMPLVVTSFLAEIESLDKPRFSHRTDQLVVSECQSLGSVLQHIFQERQARAEYEGGVLESEGGVLVIPRWAEHDIMSSNDDLFLGTPPWEA